MNIGLGMARVEVLGLFLKTKGDSLACLLPMGDISSSNPSRFPSSVVDFSWIGTSDSESEVLMSFVSSSNFNCLFISNFGWNRESESESESLLAGVRVGVLKSNFLPLIGFLLGLSVFL